MEGRAVCFLRGALQLAEQSAAAPGTAPVFIFFCALFFIYTRFLIFLNIFMHISTMYYTSLDYVPFVCMLLVCSTRQDDCFYTPFSFFKASSGGRIFACSWWADFFFRQHLSGRCCMLLVEIF